MTSDEPEKTAEVAEVSFEDSVGGKGEFENASLSLEDVSDKQLGVQALANQIASRRADRLPVTYGVFVAFLKCCKRIAKERNYETLNKIKSTDMIKLREELTKEITKGRILPGPVRRFTEFFGFRDELRTANLLVDRAERRVEAMAEQHADFRLSFLEGWFYYRDFAFYHTVTEATLPWTRNELSVALTKTLLFFLGTPIFFCYISPDENICPAEQGWLNSLYFASKTMSTVGYGDVSVDRSTTWKVFVGTMYMIIALLVTLSSFGAVVQSGVSKYNGFWERRMVEFADLIGFKKTDDNTLHSRIQLVKFCKIGDITIKFVIVNLIGVFATRLFMLRENEDWSWSWMESFYWAVQTTTTIGYGDMTKNPDQRYFDIFYLILGTYFVGAALSNITELNQQLLDTRRFFAWDRLQSNSAMFRSMDINKDGTVDQYEFVLASLIMLDKIEPADVDPIIKKYRDLCGNDSTCITTTDLEAAVDSAGDNESISFEMDADGNLEKPVWDKAKDTLKRFRSSHRNSIED
mmetsp:Transcript_17013/g.34923  ORF Transcript_17013/g.34923 Transcript_17013/m.34923 type:complete len:522 (-) Transcript_17013:47-1612(-)